MENSWAIFQYFIIKFLTIISTKGESIFCKDKNRQFINLLETRPTPTGFFLKIDFLT